MEPSVNGDTSTEHSHTQDSGNIAEKGGICFKPEDQGVFCEIVSPGVLVRVSVAMKRHHDHGKLCKENI